MVSKAAENLQQCALQVHGRLGSFPHLLLPLVKIWNWLHWCSARGLCSWIHAAQMKLLCVFVRISDQCGAVFGRVCSAGSQLPLGHYHCLPSQRRMWEEGLHPGWIHADGCRSVKNTNSLFWWQKLKKWKNVSTLHCILHCLFFHSFILKERLITLF